MSNDRDYASEFLDAVTTSPFAHVESLWKEWREQEKTRIAEPITTPAPTPPARRRKAKDRPQEPPALASKELFSREETAQIISASVPTVDRMIARGELVARYTYKGRRGRKTITRDSIEAFLKGKGKGKRGAR
jgi:hypothetical protein